MQNIEIRTADQDCLELHVQYTTDSNHLITILRYYQTAYLFLDFLNYMYNFENWIF